MTGTSPNLVRVRHLQLLADRVNRLQVKLNLGRSSKDNNPIKDNIKVTLTHTAEEGMGTKIGVNTGTMDRGTATHSGSSSPRFRRCSARMLEGVWILEGGGMEDGGRTFALEKGGVYAQNGRRKRHVSITNLS